MPFRLPCVTLVMRLAVLPVILAFAAPAQASDVITVQLDRAQIVKLPDKVQTVVVGNPMIADILVQRNGSMVLTGKSFGTTNLIAQDANGTVIGESFLRVEAPLDGMMVVQRGMDRETYSCTPQCQPSVKLGDAQSYFGAVSGQAQAREGFAKSK